ncbi:MAG: formate dehydrogenase subunit gamma [Caldimonas sp.]
MRLIRNFSLALWASAAACAAMAQAAPSPDTVTAPAIASSQALVAGVAAPSSAPAVLAPLPQPNETNAQRARSQPGNNAPFWRGVHDSGKAPGSVNNRQMGERGVLIQPFVAYPGTRMATAGEAWRQMRNWWIVPYGGALLVIVVIGMGLFFWRRGPIGHATNTGNRFIERFTYFERAAHWSNAVAFCVLAISGLVMAFGKFSVLPLTGGLLFGWITWFLKTAHNFFGPLFVVSLVIVFFTFLRSNWPSRGDLTWLLKGGGLFGGEDPPSGRFNAGEKIVFWGGVFLLGSVVVGSGLVLDMLVPGLLYTRDDMQLAHIIHSVAAVFIMVVFLGHIYIGTIGMRGSYSAMKTGYVDEAWAAEHHQLWYDDIRAGRIPAERTTPARVVQQPVA